MDPFSAAAAAGTAYGNYASTQATNEANAEIAASNNAWSAEQYAKRYQTQVADLKSAGLNPMLAYSQSPGTAPSAQQVVFQNPMAGAMDSVRSVSGAIQSTASAKQAESQSKLIDETVEKTKKETRNLDDEQTRLRAAYINLAESSALMAQQGQSEVVRRDVLEATAKKLVTENLLSRAEYDAMVKTGFIGVTAREVKVLSDVSSEWVDKFLPWRQGKASSEEHTDIVRDQQGREVGRSTYRSKR